MAAKRGERRDAESAYAGLNDRRRQFVDEYLIDLNATQAALRAGYAASRAEITGSELVRNRKVAAALQERMNARAKRTEITQDRVLNELAKLGFSDIRKAIKWGAAMPVQNEETGETLSANGVVLVDSADLDDDTAAAIQEISQTAQGIKLKLYDKKGALVDIGRHLGMFDDKLRLLGDDKNPIQTVTRIELVAAKAGDDSKG